MTFLAVSLGAKLTLSGAPALPALPDAASLVSFLGLLNGLLTSVQNPLASPLAGPLNGVLNGVLGGLPGISL